MLVHSSRTQTLFVWNVSGKVKAHSVKSYLSKAFRPNDCHFLKPGEGVSRVFYQRYGRRPLDIGF